MKKRVLNVAASIFMTVALIFLEYSKISMSGTKLVLDIPEDFMTNVHTVSLVQEDDGKLVSKADIVSDIEIILGHLPCGVLDALKPYTILITEKDVVSVYHTLNPSEMFSNFNNFKAVVIYDKHIICLDANNLSYRDSIYHEIGHVVDNSLGYISESSEFQGIYEREIESFRTNISEYPYARDKYGVPVREADWYTTINDSTEYFAESFDAYFLFGDILMDSCPETYEYLDKLFNDIGW